jgi:Bacteriophage probable baseplate hub protein
MPSPSDAVRSARPSLYLGGESQPRLEQGLSRLEIVETIQGLYRCEAEFINWGEGNGAPDFLYFDRKLLDFGKTFTVKLDTDVLFDGRIMALEGNYPEGAPPNITVLVEDRFQDLRMTRRTRSFEDLTDADVIRRIASDHGLTADVSADGPTYKMLAQVNQSDLAFLRERARSIDAELWMDDAKLSVKTRAIRRGSAIELTMAQQLQFFTATADLATQRTSVTANGWDVGGKSRLQHEAEESVIQGELNGDTSGISILRSALGERKEAVAHTVPLNSNEVQAVAESSFKNCARRFVVGRGTATTQAKLRVGALLDLKALGPLFNGKYYVVESRHLFDNAKGLRTEFTAERPGIGHS